jgi:hypothetical protein
MQIKTLDGSIQNWQLTGYTSNASIERKSSFHLLARELLRQQHPTLQILEEVTVPLRRSEVVYLDFYIPLLKKAIEVHGEQHYKFTPFYHSNQLAFLKAQKKDREKKEWCLINSIKYVELPYNEAQDQWTERLLT